MMTLGFVAVITALVLWSLSTTQKEFDRVSQIDAQNQFNLLFKDFSKMIKSFDINSSDGLELFLSMSLPGITEPKSGVTVTFRSESLMDRLNINNILYQSILPPKPDSEQKRAFLMRPLEKFFAKYELSDPYTMIDILLDTIDLDDLSRGNDTEIANEDYNFRQGQIYNFTHFQKIIKYYYKLTDDENIFKITKEEIEKYFYFGDSKTNYMIDCSSTREHILDAMSLLINDEITLTQDSDICAETNTTSMKELKKIYNISEYANKKKYLVKCIINLDTQSYKRGISFEYDVSSKRIDNIDKNFQEE